MRKLRECCRNMWHQILAAIRWSRVDKHDRVAAIKFVEHRSISWVSRPFITVVGHQADTISLERIQSVGDFLQTSFRVGQRHSGEETETVGKVPYELRQILVAFARQGARRLHVSKPNALGM